jgi:hypothetical protein
LLACVDYSSYVKRTSEVIWLDLADIELVIHAMELRATFYDLLPAGEDPMS